MKEIRKAPYGGAAQVMPIHPMTKVTEFSVNIIKILVTTAHDKGRSNYSDS